MAYVSGKMVYHPWDRNGQRRIPATPQARRGYEKPWMTNMKGLTPRQRAAIEVSFRLYGRRVSQSDGFTVFPCLESLKSDESEETGQASDLEVISNETKATSLNMRQASFVKLPLIYNRANPIVGFRRPSQTPIYLKGSIPKFPRLVESVNQALTQKFECAMDILDRIKQTRDLDLDSQKH